MLKVFGIQLSISTLCASNGVVFNPKKFHFAQKEVEFAGFSITEQGIKPSKSILEAILNFPKPANITDARSWFGLVNQVSYNISSSDMMQPFRDLLKPGHWYWDKTLDTVFERSKQAIGNIVQQGVRSFEPNRPTCLATQWSKKGLGFMLVFNLRWDMHSLRAKEIKDSPNSQAVPKILVLLKKGTVWFHIGSG